ncbi:MAG TPA: zinc-binding dehydrogenase [Acidimicrobiia bacterium]|nr:zinc-binding dehydrogenase [Acidimicrobiia bacterium]
MDEGRLTPLIGATYSLEDGPQALRDLADRRAVGKLVITVRE